VRDRVTAISGNRVNLSPKNQVMKTTRQKVIALPLIVVGIVANSGYAAAEKDDIDKS